MAGRKMKTFTMSQLADAISADRDAVRTYVHSLLKGGIIAHHDKVPAPTGVFGVKPTASNLSQVYRLVRDVGLEAPRLKRDGTPCRQGLAREQMWRTMQELVSFSPRDLAGTASTDLIPVSEVDAKAYLKALKAAGYLQVVREATKRTQACYRLIKRTGPLPPMVQRTKVVFDQNLGEIVHHEVDA
jgi:hypothetical protein